MASRSRAEQPRGGDGPEEEQHSRRGTPEQEAGAGLRGGAMCSRRRAAVRGGPGSRPAEQGSRLAEQGCGQPDEKTGTGTAAVAVVVVAGAGAGAGATADGPGPSPDVGRRP